MTSSRMVFHGVTWNLNLRNAFNAAVFGVELYGRCLLYPRPPSRALAHRSTTFFFGRVGKKIGSGNFGELRLGKLPTKQRPASGHSTQLCKLHIGVRGFVLTKQMQRAVCSVPNNSVMPSNWCTFVNGVFSKPTLSKSSGTGKCNNVLLFTHTKLLIPCFDRQKPVQQ